VIAFVVIFGSGMLGLLVSSILPKHHTAEATQAIVQTTMGTISILAALVLGLLVATAKGKFDTVSTQVEQVAGNLMLLDQGTFLSRFISANRVGTRSTLLAGVRTVTLRLKSGPQARNVLRTTHGLMLP
jgi:hypothetical protein